MRELLLFRWLIEAVLMLCELIDCLDADFFILLLTVDLACFD